MKKVLITAIILGGLGIAPAVQAISVIGFEPNVDGAPGDVTFEGYANGPQGPFAIPIPGGTLEYNNAVIVQDDGNSAGAIPFPHGNGDYLSVKAGGVATFSFTSPYSSFGFQWGSIDAYNTIEFFLGGGSVGSFTGSDVVSSPVAANGNQGLNGSAFVTFGGLFDTVVLTSTQNSFEIDNVSVSDGGMTLALLGLTLSGLAIVRRKTRVG